MKTVQISEKAHSRLYEFLHAWKLRTLWQTVDKLLSKLDEQARTIGELKEQIRKLEKMGGSP